MIVTYQVAIITGNLCPYPMQWTHMKSCFFRSDRHLWKWELLTSMKGIFGQMTGRMYSRGFMKAMNMKMLSLMIWMTCLIPTFQMLRMKTRKNLQWRVWLKSQRSRGWYYDCWSCAYPPIEKLPGGCQTQSFSVCGDNIDKTIHRRFLWSDGGNTSLHYFHSYAILNHVDFSHLSDEIPDNSTIRDLKNVALSLQPTALGDQISEQYLDSYIPHSL